MACIQCHAKVDSNIITDYGFGGDGNGNDYYFGGGGNWKSGHAYGDHSQSLKTMQLAAGQKFVVPEAARLPAAVADSTGLDFLDEYVASQLALGDDQTKQVQVETRSNVSIAAPTAEQLEQALRLSADKRFVYYKDATDSLSLKGLELKPGFVAISGEFHCEGDLAVRGPLHLADLKLHTRTGCRIYSIGSVFLYGAVEYVNQTPRSNLQITSTKAVLVGLGENKRDGAYCDPNGKYGREPGSYPSASSLKERVRFMWTVPYSFVRQSSTPVQWGQTILDEAAVIEATSGTLFDAECRPEGRNVAFQRILLNAPIVHSRYTGQVEGTIIAEFAQMTLSTFKFKFDPVLKTVPILPFLDPSSYLLVE